MGVCGGSILYVEARTAHLEETVVCLLPLCSGAQAGASLLKEHCRDLRLVWNKPGPSELASSAPVLGSLKHLISKDYFKIGFLWSL